MPLVNGTPTFRVRGQGSTRRVVIRVNLRRAAGAQVRLLRLGRVLAQRQTQGHDGWNTVVLPIRQRVARGPAKGELVLIDGQERKRYVSRLVLTR